MVKIAASILSANFAKLGQEITDVTRAGADLIHLDVMDGNFVPNLTFGPPVIKSIRPFTHLPFEAHLMINHPSKYLEDYKISGVDRLIIHYEATNELPRILQQIRALGMSSGVSIKPETDFRILKNLIEYIDIILIMTVSPGYGGQEFLNNQLIKIELVAQMIKDSDRNIELSIDGGINPDTAKLSCAHGANILVAGNYIFNNNYEQAIKNLKA